MPTEPVTAREMNALVSAGFAAFRWSRERRVIEALTQSLAGMLGWPFATDEIDEDRWLAAIDARDRQPVLLAFERCVLEGQSVQTVVRAGSVEGGRQRRLCICARPIADEPGSLLGLVLMLDSSESGLSQTGGADGQACDVLRSILEYLPVGVAVALGEECRIREVSAFGLRMAGHPREQLLDVPASRFAEAWRVLEVSGQRYPSRRTPLARACAGEIVRDDEVLFESADRQRVLALCDAGPVRDIQGQLLGGVVIWRDVTQLRQAEQQVIQLLERERASRQAAEEAGRVKDLFLATVSHELRGPLSAIAGWVDVLERGSADAALVDRAVAAIRRNVKLQTTLVNDLLDLTRLLSGKTSLNRQVVDLSTVVQSSLDDMQSDFDRAGIHVRVALTASLMVDCDPERLRQVVGNLLSNAMKFSPAGSTVTVATRAYETTARLAISDEGQGLTEDEQAHVFDRFWQAERRSGVRSAGLGLGLAIVKHLVELHGGEVSVTSEGLQRGATFTVTLPLWRDRSRWTWPSERLIEAGHPSAPLLDGRHVAVLERNRDLLEAICWSLERAQATVSPFDDPAIASAHLQRARFDAVVLGDTGPEFTRAEVVRLLGSGRGPNRNRPVVMLGQKWPTEADLAVWSGQVRVVSRPIALDALVAAIAEALQESTGR